MVLVLVNNNIPAGMYIWPPTYKNFNFKYKLSSINNISSLPMCPPKSKNVFVQKKKKKNTMEICKPNIFQSAFPLSLLGKLAQNRNVNWSQWGNHFH